jgi:hypothetical protein
MSAQAKTQSLARMEIPVSLIDPNPLNPNRMKPRAFDLLVNNLQEMGFTDAALMRAKDIALFNEIRLKHGDDRAKIRAELIEKDCRFETIGGHHRIDGAKYLGFEDVPATIPTDPDFTEEFANFQMIRHNVIRGEMDPEQFVTLYAQYAGKYDDDLLQELFGFAEEAEFKRLITATAASLPKELQSKFKDAAKEIKTIDGLARILNKIFTEHGDTLPFGYLIFDYSNEDSVWFRCEKSTIKAVYVLGDICKDNKVTMDDVVGNVIRAMAKGELQDFVEEILKKVPKVVIDPALNSLPTKNNIEKLEELSTME